MESACVSCYYCEVSIAYEGNMAAINDLLARWRGWILRKGGARGEALFSEVAWRLLKKSGSGEVHAGYLKKVTRYALIDLDRERNPDSTLLTNEVMPNRQQEKSPVQTLIEAEDVERVQNILDILSSIEREVVRMMVDGMQVP